MCCWIDMTSDSSNSSVADISEDGQLCAVFCNGNVNVYDTAQDELIYSVNQSPTLIKNLTISPSKEVISWLQTNSNQVWFCFVELAVTRAVDCLSCDFHSEFTLWSPDGNSLAVFSSHSVFTDIFKVEDDSANIVATISGATFNSNDQPVAQFSPDGELFASVNLCGSGHVIMLYTTTGCSWICVKRIFINGCDDVGGMLWCRDSASMLVWQSKRELRLQLWTVCGRQQHKLVQTSPHVTAVSLSCCGRMAAIMTADSEVQIIDMLTWQPGPMGVMSHCPILHKSSLRSMVREPEHRKGQIMVCEPISTTFFELRKVLSITAHKPLMQFSPSADYLASYEPLYPNTLWVWNLITTPLLDTVVILSDDTKILGLLWHSKKTCLAASLTGNKLLVWSPQQSTIITSNNNKWPFTPQYYFATVPD